MREISRFADVYVVTRDRNRPFIEEELARSPLANVHWIYVPILPWLHEANHLQYYLWQRRIRRTVRMLHEEVGFDLVHHVTYAMYWLPTPLRELGVPFLWGPVGGGEQANPELARGMSILSRSRQLARRVTQRSFERNPHLHETAAKAGITLAATEETARRVTMLGARDVRIMPTVGLGSEDYHRLSSLPVRTDHPPRLISIGRLIQWKGFDLGIDAFSLIAQEYPAAEYWIVGDGVERRRLERLATRRGVRDRVRFLGFRTRDRALNDLASCDILVHPSMHDSGGMVTLEAMAAGLPVICLDTGGPALQIEQAMNGYKIPPGPRKRVVRDLADAMSSLLADPAERARKGAAGRAFVYRYFHSEVGSRMESIYHELLAGSSRPR